MMNEVHNIDNEIASGSIDTNLIAKGLKKSGPYVLMGTLIFGGCASNSINKNSTKKSEKNAIELKDEVKDSRPIKNPAIRYYSNGSIFKTEGVSYLEFEENDKSYEFTNYYDGEDDSYMDEDPNRVSVFRNGNRFIHLTTEDKATSMLGDLYVEKTNEIVKKYVDMFKDLVDGNIAGSISLEEFSSGGYSIDAKTEDGFRFSLFGDNGQSGDGKPATRFTVFELVNDDTYRNTETIPLDIVSSDLSWSNQSDVECLILYTIDNYKP